ncbi:MAG: Grx4 family monothiol glutaredoxin [Cyanobacteria bacterium P01_D01_bin.123]
MSQAIHDVIQQQVNDNKVLLYMKGTPDFPQCGFSAATVQVLKSLGYPFAAVNVLEDAEIRQGIKAFSNWPTIPQVYVNGEFIGGCDIVLEMNNRGELEPLLKSAAGEVATS